jgi:two-component sensor histidine kinase
LSLKAYFKALLLISLFTTYSLSLELKSGESSYRDFELSYLKSNKSFEEIKEEKDGWERGGNSFAFGYYFDDLWIKLEIDSPQSSGEYVLEFSEPFANVFDFYVVDSEGVRVYKNGLSTPLQDRDIKWVLPALKLEFSKGERKQIYIKYRSKFTSYGELELYTKAKFDEIKTIYSAFYFFYFGGIFIIAMYNLFLFLALKDRSYFYYVGYALTFMTWVFLYSGFSLYFVDGEIHHMLHFTTPFAFVFFTLFTQNILETKRHLPLVHKYLDLMTFVLLLSALYIVFDVEHGYYMATMIGLFYFPFLIFVAILSIKKGVKTAKFYLASFLVFIFTMSVVTNLAMGLIEFSLVAKYSFVLGSMIELVLFSLLLAYRINILKEERLSAQKSLLEAKKSEALRLEKRVNEKTEDLKVANTKLQHMIDDRENLLRELHHRVKNNLQIITGMLWIQIKKPLNKEDTEILDDLLKRIKSMALVHELLYASDSTAQIPTNVYFDKLIDSVLYGMKTKKIELKKSIEDVNLSAEESIAVGTVITEAMTNSIKHASKEDGSLFIDISLKHIDGKYILKVADSGDGFDEHKSNTDGFGIKIIQKTARTLKNSSVKYHKDKENGLFNFILTFDK